MLKKLISIYRLFISPALHLFFGPTLGCRFVPSCSQYGREALDLHGSLRGAWLIFGRILRCHPFARARYDPVPRAIERRDHHHE